MLNSSVYNNLLNEATMKQGSARFIEAYRTGCYEESLKI